MRIWNELMLTEHYLKAATLVGRQLRYLIRSEQGWLGGIGYASPALQLSARDQWIGWNQEERQAHLHSIVGMSRFLIRPSVSCKNLASKVLGMSLATIADDFEQQYGCRPLLIESFVDTERYSGTCYQATNWLAVGKTKGRGRQDRFSRLLSLVFWLFFVACRVLVDKSALKPKKTMAAISRVKMMIRIKRAIPIPLNVRINTLIS